MTHREQLVAAASGDDRALAELVRSYHERVYRYGVRVCRDGFDADDAVQEAFTKLSRRPDVVADPSALSWLFSVVRNACVRMLRPFVRERRSLGERVAETEELPADSLDPESALERQRLVHAVHEAISKLSRSSREVLVMRDLEGLSGPETCSALGLSQATMKTRLHHARAELRSELAELRSELERVDAGIRRGAVRP